MTKIDDDFSPVTGGIDLAKSRFRDDMDQLRDVVVRLRPRPAHCPASGLASQAAGPVPKPGSRGPGHADEEGIACGHERPARRSSAPQIAAMISVERALAFARRHYPEGPEKLAEQLGVRVAYSAMSGCDGWCLTYGGRAVIRINSGQVKSRQRFTLAHELGHLLLDIPSVIGESFTDILQSNDARGATRQRSGGRVAHSTGRCEGGRIRIA